jgi:hypothetical protein
MDFDIAIMTARPNSSFKGPIRSLAYIYSSKSSRTKNRLPALHLIIQCTSFFLQSIILCAFKSRFKSEKRRIKLGNRESAHGRRQWPAAGRQAGRQ